MILCMISNRHTIAAVVTGNRVQYILTTGVRVYIQCKQWGVESHPVNHNHFTPTPQPGVISWGGLVNSLNEFNIY